MDMGPVVRGALENEGLRVTVVRILTTERPTPHGGPVTYLATVSDDEHVPSRLRTFRWGTDRGLPARPIRAQYAHIGGPEADLEWARSQLPQDARVGEAEQHRTWNLSSIWRIPTGRGSVWLKHVPAFFAHERALLCFVRDRLGRADVPRLLAHDSGRLLLDDVPAPIATRRISTSAKRWFVSSSSCSTCAPHTSMPSWGWGFPTGGRTR